jgi:hypothetical protein
MNMNGAFVPGKPFQPSLMFAGMARAYPSEEPFRCSKTRLEKLARDKRYKLLRKVVTYGRKKFYNIGPCAKKINYNQLQNETK